jgi:D-alanyl-lipoteichoic acid acyltransferase DltB (MBOAT superfamily)
MLFNSIQFIFLFLPVVLVGYFFLGRYSFNASICWLAAASLAFYAWWDFHYILLIVSSVMLNYIIGLLINKSLFKVFWFVLGITFNVCLLGYYKYANFFVENLHSLFGVEYAFQYVILPLGISFFTFTQIAYLVDVRRGVTKEYKFQNYLLFAIFFPHLIAGPILHHNEIIPQFQNPKNFRPNVKRISEGLTFFTLGLAKKILIADNIAPYANDIFRASEDISGVSFFEAWQGALCYTLQIYFDFSGYCDMAIGVALLFGIRMPVNFNSPYRATSIINFWRSWHITLSRFLRDYLYIPLGGSRCGSARYFFNLMVVMLLGGLWHGAGWTFIAWGALHGFYLAINHLWRFFLKPIAPSNIAVGFMYWTITFLCVVFAWVFFRADSMFSAFSMIKGMLGFNGFELELNHRNYFGALAEHLEALGIVFTPGTEIRLIAFPLIVGFLAVCLFLPNSQNWIWHHRPLFQWRKKRILVWRATLCWGLILGLLAAYTVSKLGRPSEFLYFNF